MKNNTKIKQPDYDAAIAYALSRLRNELPSSLLYHCAAHTESDVLPAVLRLAALCKVGGRDLQLLKVATAFHDIGQIWVSLSHERIGIEIVLEVLPQFGFDEADISRVIELIRATEMPQNPLDIFQEILADADLDSLGREDFFTTSTALWFERASRGMTIPWQEWLETQLKFLRAHRYFTAAARTLRDEGKRRNIDKLQRMLRGEPPP